MSHCDIIRHSLGLGQGKKPYRDFYCTEDGDPELEDMVNLGLMARGCLINNGRDRYYHVTKVGAESVGSKLPPP